MGMSANAMTIVPTVKAAKLIATKTFALCFMKGGGTMMLGGANQAAQVNCAVLVNFAPPSVAGTDV